MPWYLDKARSVDTSFAEKARQRQLNLTKPPGSLGALEDIAVRFSVYQSTLKPAINKPAIVVMAADHGVAAEKVSAFPQAVTGEMVKNFATGGAAIAVLARQLQADFTVINLGTVNALPEINNVLDRRIAPGSGNICIEPAMTEEQCDQAMMIGRQAVADALAREADLFIGGEMGIANTTPAACLAARLLGKYPVQVVGSGTGIDSAGLVHKAAVVERALARHPVTEPIAVLQSLGGFESAGLAGSYIAAAQSGLPVLLDGYIASAAALAAVAINPSIRPWLLASHRSAEPGHGMMLHELDLAPLLDLAMHLGEGSGAAVTVPLIQSACRLQSEMASFDDAGVSGKIDE